MIRAVKKAVIPVAGLGTRMLPATKAIPKELLPVFDRPLIEYIVSEAIEAGINEIILVTRSGKEAIENHFDAHYELEHRLEKKNKRKILSSVQNIIPSDVRISSVRQADALGLGHAVLCAKHLLNNEPFAVLLPDVLVLDKEHRANNFSFINLVNAWDQTGVGQLMVERIPHDRVNNYGVIDPDIDNFVCFESFKLRGLIEKPEIDEAPSNLSILGRYVLPPKILDILEKTSVGVGGEIQLTDALSVLLRHEGLNAFETDASIFDCGNKLGFVAANMAVGIRDIEAKKYIKKTIDELM